MDPLTGAKSSEPLLTLSRTRGGRPNFGVHLYYRRSSDHNFNYSGQALLHTLKIGEDCRVIHDEGWDRNNITPKSIFKKVLEKVQNID